MLPYYDNIVLLLPMEGANDSTTFTDYSSSPKTITPSGNAKISTAQSKWGQGSGYFDGTGDYLVVENSSAWTFGYIDYFIGAHVWFSGFATNHAYGSCLFDTRDASASYAGFALFANTSGVITAFDANAVAHQSASASVITNQWYYMSVERANGVQSVNLNGTSLFSYAAAYNHSGNKLTIGTTIDHRTTTASFKHFGYMQDLIVARRSAPSNFTPPSALWRPATIGGTVLVSGNGGADQVVVRDVATRKLAAIATPNATTGVWSATVQEGEYDISYFADGAQPVCHGPYTITA